MYQFGIAKKREVRQMAEVRHLESFGLVLNFLAFM
jgi:hypothetical protein